MVGPKKRRRSRGLDRNDWCRVSVLCLLAASVGGCKPKPPSLDELTSVEQLKERFNRDASATRIVLLLTPT